MLERGCLIETRVRPDLPGALDPAADFVHLNPCRVLFPGVESMAMAPILHVGEDTCYRIPVMERAGMVVCRAACSAEGVLGAFTANPNLSALTFDADTGPIPDAVLTFARSRPSTLVLFEDPGVAYVPDDFDLVIPSQTRPEIWLQCIDLVLESSWKLREDARVLREASAEVRLQTQHLRARLHQLLRQPIDLNRIWRGETNPASPLRVRRSAKNGRR